MDLSRIANHIRSRKYSHLLSLQFSNVPQPPPVQLITQFLTMVKEKIELYQSSDDGLLQRTDPEEYPKRFLYLGDYDTKGRDVGSDSARCNLTQLNNN